MSSRSLQAEIARATQGKPVRIVSLTTITQARMRKYLADGFLGEKELNPFWERGAVKVALRVGMVGVDYAKAVVAQRRREQGSVVRDQTSPSPLTPSPFRPGPLWRGKGVHVDRHFVKHVVTGTRYLKFLPTIDDAGRPQISRLKYFYADTFGAEHSEEIPEREIQRWLVAERQPKTQSTRRPVRWRCITTSNVIEIKIAGQHYTFTDAAGWSRFQSVQARKQAA